MWVLIATKTHTFSQSYHMNLEISRHPYTERCYFENRSLSFWIFIGKMFLFVFIWLSWQCCSYSITNTIMCHYHAWWRNMCINNVKYFSEQNQLLIICLNLMLTRFAHVQRSSFIPTFMKPKQIFFSNGNLNIENNPAKSLRCHDVIKYLCFCFQFVRNSCA